MTLDFSLIKDEVLYYRPKPSGEEYKLEPVTFKEFIPPYVARVSSHSANPRRSLYNILEQEAKKILESQQEMVHPARTIKGDKIIKDQELQVALLLAAQMLRRVYLSDIMQPKAPT